MYQIMGLKLFQPQDLLNVIAIVKKSDTVLCPLDPDSLQFGKPVGNDAEPCLVYLVY